MRIEIYLSYDDIKAGSKMARFMPNRVRDWWKGLVSYHWRCNHMRRHGYREKEDFMFFFPPIKKV